MRLEDYIAECTALMAQHGPDIEVVTHGTMGGINALQEARAPVLAYEREKRPRETSRKFWHEWDKSEADVPHWPVIRI